MPQTTHDYSIRYASNWGDIANFTKKLTNGKCVCCNNPATEVHHARYAESGMPLAGKEKPLIDVFPLCDGHHSEAHQKQNWVHDFENPVHGNHNTPEYHQHLLKCAEPYRPKPQPKMQPRAIVPVVVEEWEPYSESEGFNPLNLIYGLLAVMLFLLFL